MAIHHDQREVTNSSIPPISADGEQYQAHNGEEQNHKH